MTIATFFHCQVPNTLGLRGPGILPSNVLLRTNDSWKWNISIIAGWIPLIGGIIAGIYHGIAGLEDHNRALIARGIAEIICLGPLLGILDVITTLGRSATINSVDLSLVTEQWLGAEAS